MGGGKRFKSGESTAWNVNDRDNSEHNVWIDPKLFSALRHISCKRYRCGNKAYEVELPWGVQNRNIEYYQTRSLDWASDSQYSRILCIWALSITNIGGSFTDTAVVPIVLLP